MLLVQRADGQPFLRGGTHGVTLCCRGPSDGCSGSLSPASGVPMPQAGGMEAVGPHRLFCSTDFFNQPQGGRRARM